MGRNPRRLLCTWHVDRTWLSELRVKVKDIIVAADIYKMLSTLLQDTNVTSFQDHMTQFQKHLPTVSTEFATYFQCEWHGKADTWAYCYRTRMGINTNMAVEAFHQVFKYNYLKGKVNKRVDNCLNSLLDRHNKSKECKICIHQYLCDCPDSLIHNTICKHVHLLHQYFQNFPTNKTYRTPSRHTTARRC